MEHENWGTLEEEAKKMVKEAANIIKKSFDKELIVEFKANPNDLVTEMDRSVENYFKKVINNKFPEHHILGEEGTGKELTSLNGVVWIIDPIDGTTNFVHQQRNFAISVAVYKNGIGMIGIIYDVMADELFTAIKGQGAFLNNVRLPQLKKCNLKEALIAINSGWVVADEKLMQLVRDCRGTRSIGAAAIEIASVAANRLDGYISLQLSPWDFAAGAVLIKEVGAHISRFEGGELNLLQPCSISVAKTNLFEELQSYCKKG